MKQEIIKYFSQCIYEQLYNCEQSFFNNIEEIRIRVNKPLIVKSLGSEIIINKNFCPSIKDMKETIQLMSEFSLYSYEDEIKNGYITLPDGHRVGLCGKVVIENEKVKTISHISAINVRFSHEIKGCADGILKHAKGSVLIISPPGCGKTTLLRDIVRQVSDGGQTVGIVDERSEIAASYLGVPQNDVGMRTDVLDSCRKSLGIMMLLRSMSPDIIAVDEIGRQEDVIAIEEALTSGVKLFCTVHGSSIQNILEKPHLAELIKRKIFDTYIILGYGEKPGEIKQVLNKNMKEVDI
ncbi:MAG: stage III sporulation protein AA [Defluviitaleaceae bacterium]|nr:stage III sporulation protein AA [Defluviitaleaceae bacterium]